MARPIYRYKIVKKISDVNIHEKLRPLFSQLKIGEIISTNSFYDQFRDEIDIKGYLNVWIQISEAINIAQQAGLVEKIDNSTIPQWFIDLKTVSLWLSFFRGSKYHIGAQNKPTTKSTYLSHLWHFNKWLSGKEFQVEIIEDVKSVQRMVRFESVEDMIKILDEDYGDAQDIAKIIKTYLIDEMHKNKKASTMSLIKTAIGSYFRKNGFHLDVEYDPKATHSTEVKEKIMTLSDLTSILTIGRPTVTEKAVILCKFHRGLDTSTLVDRFNYEAWDQMVEWFGGSDYNEWDLDKCPVPISLMRVKNGYQHIGYLDRDAITSLKAYLNHRKEKTGAEMHGGEAMFLIKGNLPLTANWLSRSISHLAERSGAQSFVLSNGKKIYNIDPHKVRNLLKSTLIDCGCKQHVANHMIGDSMGGWYEKITGLYHTNTRNEYAKASKKINVCSTFESVVKEEYVSSLKRELDGARATQKRMEEENVLRGAAMKRYDDALNERLRQIDDWEGKMKAAKEREVVREKDMKNALEEIRKLKSHTSIQH